ncbi:hypothetical protein LDENG_00277290 [Lucifuga dentata]|nr:hypothetical protein LDENG_00277290 [Lucifuga dentata]
MEASSGPDYCPLVQLWLNISSDPSDSTDSMSPTNIFLAILHGLVSLIGVLGNLLILGVVGVYVRSSVISTWIINLVVSNFLTTITLPFFTVYMAYNQTWAMGSMLCRLLSSVFFLNMFVSGFLLAAISLDRCLIVVKPVWTQIHRNIQSVGKICVLIWVLALLCTIPFYLFRDTISHRNGKIWCNNNYAQFLPAGHSVLSSLCKTRQEALALMKLFLAFLIPLMIIIISYVTVTVRLKRRGWRRPFRFGRLVVAVVVCFIFCWAPYHFLSTLEALVSHMSPLHRILGSAIPVSVILAFLNSILNPILYVLMCPDVCSKMRRSLRAVMETVLAEDFLEAMRHRSSLSYSGKWRPSLPSAEEVSEEEEKKHEHTPMN